MIKKFNPKRELTLAELTDLARVLNIQVPEVNMDMIPESLHEHFEDPNIPRILVAKQVIK